MIRWAFTFALLLFGAAACSHHRQEAPAASTGRGAALYAQNCQACHGVRGKAGPVGPSLAGEHTRKNLGAVVAIIEHPYPPMPKLYPGELTKSDVADIAAYVESL
jgi:mono/diheme cytochrome c family protein